MSRENSAYRVTPAERHWTTLAERRSTPTTTTTAQSLIREEKCALRERLSTPAMRRFLRTSESPTAQRVEGAGDFCHPRGEQCTRAVCPDRRKSEPGVSDDLEMELAVTPILAHQTDGVQLLVALPGVPEGRQD
ncbi:MAG TPA: hypothetical protein VIX19_01080 [Terriglobales bacterium]